MKTKKEKITKEGLIFIIVIMCIIIGCLLMRSCESANSRTRMDKIYREYFGEDEVDKMYEELYEKELYEQDERDDRDIYEFWRP